MCGVVPTRCQQLLELPSNTRELQTTQQNKQVQPVFRRIIQTENK